jgi:hypothetical protein
VGIGAFEGELDDGGVSTAVEGWEYGKRCCGFASVKLAP